MRHLLQAVQSSDVVQGVDGGREATVQAEDLVKEEGGCCQRGGDRQVPEPAPLGSPYLGVDQRRERQVVEEVGEVLPHVGVAVLPQTLVVEAVHLRDLPALVVSPQDGDALAVANLHAATEDDRITISVRRGRALNVAWGGVWSP